MSKSVLIAVLTGIIALSGCDKDLMNRKKTTYDFINIQGLLDTLAEHTGAGNPLVIKYSSVNKNTDSSRMRLDTARGEWKKELNIFVELNVRSSRLAGRYSREEQTLRDNHNLIIWRANNYTSEDLDSIKLWQRHGNIDKIEFYINQSNNLFRSKRYYRLIFIQQNDHPVLKSYFIKGHQKMKMNDSTTFVVNTRLEY